MFGWTRRNTRDERWALPPFAIPTHWIDTTPVESTDKPCHLASLDMQVRVSGLYADVTETIVLYNPNRRDISVDIAIPMPDRAVVSGYGLDIDGQIVDGVVVPKEQARIAFETEQRIGADPGLVEAVKGNVYRTRVYPVPRRKSRTVKLRYVAPLLVQEGTGAFLDVPMPAELIGERTVQIDVELLECPMPELSGVKNAQFKDCGVFWKAESHERGVVPESNIYVTLPKLPTSFALVERDEAGDVWFEASECVPDDEIAAVPSLSSLTVLWDASGSRAGVDHEAELELLRGYCAAEGVESYRLLVFGDQVEPAREFAAADELLAYIGALRYDGGSDFQVLAQALAALPETDGAGACVLFTDGMDTLASEVVAFPGERKVLAVVSGTQRDAEALRRACGGLVFDVCAAPKSAEALAKALFCSNLLSGVAGEGVAEVLGIGSGADGRFSVVGKLVAPSANVSFSNTGTEFALAAENARDGGTIARAWAAMRVAQLSTRADENADELLSLGRRFGVVSPATSLLVLETLDQWLRYDIEPPATWESMHNAWEAQREGRMQVSSEQAVARYHVEDLKRAWAELKEWWERDFTRLEPPVRPGGRRFCHRCGAQLDAGSFFCATCGVRVPGARLEEEVHRRSMPDGAPDVMLRRAVDSVPMAGGMPDFDDRELFLMADSAPMRTEAMPDSSPAMACTAASAYESDSAMAWEERDGVDGTTASVKVQPWMPDADYLCALDDAFDDGLEAARDAYFQERATHATSPSFFIDCAGWFLEHDDAMFGLRVLSNLAELRIENAALLRVMAWRLREAGELERALIVLRRVLKLRPEDSQSHRDLALVLDELARKAFGEGDEDLARQRAEEAGAFYRKIALTPWQRRAQSIGLFAVEEYNVLRAWADAQTWKIAPRLESLGAEFEGVLDCDLRITLAWDADETDVDLHVTEPSGEEAYYGNRLTHDGGRVSEDITDGYGPELYEIHRAFDGDYVIRAHYYASHQQTIFGPASCTLTVYTDWGRPTQTQQVTSTRLEREHEMVHVGVATYGSTSQQ